MGAVIKAGRADGVAGVFQFDDMSQAYLTKVKAEAEKIIADARKEGERLKAAAQQEGREQGLAGIKEQVKSQLDQQLQTLLPALAKAVQEIQTARHLWRERWEKSVIDLSCAIARRIVRRELAHRPEITLDFVREALELASGNEKISLRLHPRDHAALADRAAAITRELSGLGPVEIIADDTLTPGGCKVSTEYGVIDEQLESQLSRITEELLATD